MPRPDDRGPRERAAARAGTPPRGYQTYAPHASQRGITQLAARRAREVRRGQRVVDVGQREVVALDRHGHAVLREHERARHVAGVAAVHRDLAVGHLRGRGAAQLLHALDDVRDAEHVRVRQQPAVRVERQLARVVVQRVALDERAGLALRAEAHVLDLHEAHDGERVVDGEHVDVGGREPAIANARGALNTCGVLVNARCCAQCAPVPE